MIKLLNSQSRISESDLADVERRFGFRFPDELKKLYLEANGGRPKKNRFLEEDGYCIVHDFLPIKYRAPTLNTLETLVHQLKISQKLLPEKLIPFALEPTGRSGCTVGCIVRRLLQTAGGEG